MTDVGLYLTKIVIIIYSKNLPLVKLLMELSTVNVVTSAFLLTRRFCKVCHPCHSVK